MSRDESAADVYELAACALLTLWRDGTIERANRAACAWTGYSFDELKERRFQDLLTIGSKLFHQTHWLPLLEMQGSVAEVQLELATRDGRKLPALVNGVRRPDGRTDIALFLASDRRKYERELLLARRRAEELLEALRQREDEFRTIAENSPDVIARFDRDRRCTYVNRAVERLTRPASEILGKRVDELAVQPEIARAFRSALDEALAGKDVTQAFRLERPHGGEVDIEVRSVPERSAGGEVNTVLVLTRDVTALKEQEREARQRAVFAEQLVGIVSHDLRNPLNAIMLGVQLLGAVDLGPHGRIVERIVNAAKRATRLTAELLDFTQARLGAGLPVAPTEISLHVVVAECVEELRLAWPGRALEHCRVGAGMGIADPDRLGQVVMNLVGNAMAYGTREEPVSVTSVVGDDTLEILVHNGGKPIPERLQRDIFEPLRRGENQIQRGSRSVGLGLYIVREIAASHGGSVSVRSSAEAGTTFHVRLPRAHLAKEAAQRAADA